MIFSLLKLHTITIRLKAWHRAIHLFLPSSRILLSGWCRTWWSHPLRSSDTSCPIYSIPGTSFGEVSSGKNEDARLRFIMRGRCGSLFVWDQYNSKARSRQEGTLDNCIVWFDIRWTFPRKCESLWRNDCLPSVFWGDFGQSILIHSYWSSFLIYKYYNDDALLKINNICC